VLELLRYAPVPALPLKLTPVPGGLLVKIVPAFTTEPEPFSI
jgi:hypothetical protein